MDVIWRSQGLILSQVYVVQSRPIQKWPGSATMVEYRYQAVGGPVAIKPISGVKTCAL